MPTLCSSSRIRARAAAPVSALMQRQAFADLPFDGVQRVQAGHRLLEDEADVVAAHLRAARARDAPTISRAADSAPTRDTSALSGSSATVDSAVTDLPDPLSPTSATVSPLADGEADTPLHRLDHPAVLPEADGQVLRPPERALIGRSFGVEGIADAFEDEDQQATA